MKTSEWFKPVEDLGLKEYAGVLIPDGKLCQHLIRGLCPSKPDTGEEEALGL